MLPFNPAGLKTVPVTPFPLNVPPASPVTNAARSIGSALEQRLPGADHEADNC